MTFQIAFGKQRTNEKTYLSNHFAIRCQKQRPIMRNNGTVVARSTLGDPQIFAEIHSKSQEEKITANHILLAQTSNEVSKRELSKKAKQARPQEALPATICEVLKDLANYPVEYIANLRTLQQTMISVKRQCLERSTSLVKFLPIYEQTSLNKEAAIIANWQEHQREWGRIQTHISRKVGTPKVHKRIQH